MAEQKNADKQMSDVPQTIEIDISDVDYSVEVKHNCNWRRSTRELNVKFTDVIFDLCPIARLMRIRLNVKKHNSDMESLITDMTKWLALCQIDLLQIISNADNEYVLKFTESFSFFKLKKIKLMFSCLKHKEFMESFIEQFKEKYPDISVELYAY